MADAPSIVDKLLEDDEDFDLKGLLRRSATRSPFKVLRDAGYTPDMDKPGKYNKHYKVQRRITMRLRDQAVERVAELLRIEWQLKRHPMDHEGYCALRSVMVSGSFEEVPVRYLGYTQVPHKFSSELTAWIPITQVVEAIDLYVDRLRQVDPGADPVPVEELLRELSKVIRQGFRE